MTNPIDNGPRIVSTGVGGSSRTGQAAGKAQSTDKDAATVPGADRKVESERLQQVREKIDSAPEIDMARVDKIKRAIAEGQYPVDPKRIAEKFVELEGLLNG